MAAQPQRRREPLETSRRPDDSVLGHRVVARIVQEMAPLVDIVRPGFPRHGPFPVPQHAGRPARGQNTHRFILRDFAGVLDDNQVDEIIRVRQRRSGELLHAGGAVKALTLEVISRLGHLGRVGLKTLDGILVPRPQGRGQLAIPAAEVNDDPALHPALVEDSPGQSVGIVALCLRGTGPKNHRQKCLVPTD